jgi:hypothetical protein
MGVVTLLVLGLLVLVAGPLGPGVATTARAQVEPSVTIDFDDAPANRSGTPAAPDITDRYAELGVVFATPVTPLVFDAESFPALPDFARSGSTVITTCYSEEFCTNRVELSLDRGHEAVRMYVGHSSPLAEPAELVVEGFGDDGVVAAASVVLGPSEAPVPVDTLVGIEDPDGGIRRVVVRWADPGRFFSNLAIDDLGLTPFAPRIGLRADPSFLFLDGSAGAVSAAVTVENVGNVEVAIADALVDTAGELADRVTVVDTDCPGVLPRGASCEVVVAYDPVPGEDTTGLVLVTGEDGSPLLAVDLEVAGPAPEDTTGPDDETEPDDPTPTTEADETTPPDDGPTEAVGTGTDNGTASPGAGWLVAVLAAAAAVGGIAWWWRRRPGTSGTRPVATPPEPQPSQPAPRVGVRARADAGTQAVQPTGDPVVSIRARLRPNQGHTILHDPHAGEEGPPP